jgi:predicted Zn finger-like uncharacterized protein
MNVSCTSCSAKYAVPEEKIRGKKVKITCKHCGAGIIVDGTKLGAPAAAAQPAAAAAKVPADDSKRGPAAQPEAAPDARAQEHATVRDAQETTRAQEPAAAAPEPPPAPTPASEERFDVAYPDDRQESLTLSELVDKYAAGQIDEDAYVWQEGMANWQAPFEVQKIAAALGARGVNKRVAQRSAPAEDEPTAIHGGPLATGTGALHSHWREPGKEAPSQPEAVFELRGQGEPAAQPLSARAAEPLAAAPAKTAARRAAARGGGDLFSGLSLAGSEQDESLGSATAAADTAAKLTGARNESSVLFSLDALTKKEAPKKASTPEREDDAALLLGAPEAPSSIANVSGGFGSAFAAPDFTAPVQAASVESRRASDPVELSTPAEPKKRGAGLWIALGAVALAAAGAVALDLPARLSAKPEPAPSAAAAVAAPKSEAPPEPAAAVESAAPIAVAASATSVASAPAAAAPTPAAAAAPAAEKKPAAAEAAATTDKAAAPEKPEEIAAQDKPAADAPAFDRAAAVAALTEAAASAQSCKTEGGPTGSGKVNITFIPSGRASNTQVSGDLSGTSVGGCVARVFRNAKVPAFSGEPVTVSKSFNIQ